jgi:hypothetical protein
METSDIMKKEASLMITKFKALWVLLGMVVGAGITAAVIATTQMGAPSPVSAAPTSASLASSTHLISESSILDGLAVGAVFPFIDTTPNEIQRAHIAVTDATTSCAAGASPPANVQVLVGQAGVALVSVMTAATNTGISTTTVTTVQCVFHVTVVPGQGGVPATVTDIVVRNGGGAPLTGVNTITVSAEVR